MSARNPHYDANRFGGYDSDAAGRFATFELQTGDRISPAPRRRLPTMLSASLVLAVLSAGAWGLYQTHAVWQPWATAALDAASTALDRNSPTRTDVKSPGEPSSAASVDAAALAAQPLAARDVADAPGREAGAAQPAAPEAGAAPTDATTAPVTSDAESSQDDDAAPPQPLPQIAEPTDPLEKRAFAIGLHPDLSRALLTRLSDADYRNAAIAVRTALSASSEDEVVIWPRQEQAKLARFEIRFVRGAPADCRRYVVTITKDRWATTAHPMEKCGASLSTAKSRIDQ